MKIKKEYIFLILIFLLTLSIRLYYAFQTPYFDVEAYSIIREVDHIQKAVTPLFKDDLSYGGRNLIFPPYYYYVIFFFKIILGSLTFKLVPNIFASLLVFVVYMLSFNITKDYKASLFTSLISGFIPIFFYETINNISVYTLIVPLTFFTLFCFIKISENKKYVIYFITSLALLRLSHPSAILLVLVLLLYLLIVRLEGLRYSREELELILFSTFIMVWSLFIVFKKPLLVHGPYVIWQNIPAQVLYRYFSEFNILEAIYNIGIVPFVFGIYIIYNFTLRKKDKKTYLLVSFAILMLILLWLKLIQLKIGLMFLSVILTILFAIFFCLFFSYLEKTKFYKFKPLVYILLFFLIIITSFLPSITSAKKSIVESVNSNEIRALEWIKSNTEQDDVILSTVEEGYLITSIAERKNVADPNFLLIEDAEQRVKDIEQMYVTIFETEAIDLLNKYRINYIYFSDRAKKQFGIQEIKYIDETCFELVYDNKIKIYKSLCIMEE